MPARRRIKASGSRTIEGGTGDTIIIQAGDVDQTIDIGDLESYIDEINGRLDAQDLGDWLSENNVEKFVTRIIAGSQSSTYTEENATGELTVLVGAEDNRVLAISTDGTFTDIPLGSSTSNFSASSTIEASHAATTSVANGLNQWQNTENAEGTDGNTFAEIRVQNETLSGASAETTMFLGTYSAFPSPPAGFTRTLGKMVVRQAVKPHVNDLDLVSTVSFVITAYASGNQQLQVLDTWDDDSDDELTPQDYEYQLTATDFDNFNNIRFAADINLAVGGATTSDIYWRVYYALQEATYVNNNIT